MVVPDEEHILHCVLFAFQLKKNAAEAAGMISCVLGKSAVRKLIQGIYARVTLTIKTENSKNLCSI
jgi:hypothetical protein